MNDAYWEPMFELAENIAIDDGIDVVQVSRMVAADDHVILRVQSVTGHEFLVTLVGDYYGDLLCEVAPMLWDFAEPWKWDALHTAKNATFSTLQAVGF